MDDETMYLNAVETAQAEINIDRNDAFAWFNLGTSLVGLERYEDAAVAFDEARRLGLPWRFTWYQFAPFEAYMQVGRYDAVIDMANAVIAKIGSEEPYYYLGMAQWEQGKIDEALKSLDLALYYNENFKPAKEAYLALNALQEQQE
jgi:tetratricopeptide (TPR) repeat protein